MSTAPISFTPRGLYIGGQWSPSASGQTLTSRNPATGEVLGEVPLANEEDVNRAVAAAKQAFATWRNVPTAQRATCLEQLADRVIENSEELALMDAIDSGNALAGMRGDMKLTAESLRYFAAMLREVKGETLINGPRHLNFTMRQPFGVVAKINPFNHPFRFCADKVAAPLAAGNCVVVKQPEQTPLSGLRFGELCEGIFPDGVVNVLTGDAATGSALVRHPDVHRIAFIGSVETGRMVAKEAAEGLKKVSLELGGKNPIIIFPDADPQIAAKMALKGMNMNRQGQSCSSTSRVFVHQSIHDEVVGHLVEEAEKLTIGFPWLEQYEVGPIVSQQQYDRVMGFIASGKEEGALLLTGGGKPEGEMFEHGFFVSPTVFDGVQPHMRIAREEIFGPVMSVFSWDDYEAMIGHANELMYGLTAAIVTNDLAQAMETAQRVEAGYVWINTNGRYLGAPYGGWKQSGIGQEECFEELLSYTQIKNVNMGW